MRCLTRVGPNLPNFLPDKSIDISDINFNSRLRLITWCDCKVAWQYTFQNVKFVRKKMSLQTLHNVDGHSM